MSGYGLQVFDPSGTVLLDITDRITSVYANVTASITTGTANPLVISVSGVNASGGFFAIGNSGLCSITLGSGVINVYWWFTGTYTIPITVFQC